MRPFLFNIEIPGHFWREGKGEFLVLEFLGTFEGVGKGEFLVFSCDILVYRDTKLLRSSKILKFLGTFEGKGREGGIPGIGIPGHF